MPGTIAEVTSLAGLFFGAAWLYSAAGFGGGSAYIALLVLFNVPLSLVAPLALACNLVVVSNGTWHFWRGGYLHPLLLTPFLLTSLPASFAAGSLRGALPGLPLVTGIALLLVAAVMFLRVDAREGRPPEAIAKPALWSLGLFFGATLGTAAGLIGIGGGIFLAPLLYVLGWGSARQVAAAASCFILVNSVAGLLGQATAWLSLPFTYHLPFLLAAVLAGGSIGSQMGSRVLTGKHLRQLTAVLMLAAAIRLLS